MDFPETVHYSYGKLYGLKISTHGRHYFHRQRTPARWSSASCRPSGSGLPAEPLRRAPRCRPFGASLKPCKSRNRPWWRPMTASLPKGVIQSRRGSGFYVAGHLPPLSLAELGPRLDRVVDPFWVSRQSLEAGDERAETRLRLAACVVVAGGGFAPRIEIRRARRRCRAGRLRHIPRAPRAAATARPAHGGSRHRSGARSDHPHRIRHAGNRSALPLAARTGRYSTRR